MVDKANASESSGSNQVPLTKFSIDDILTNKHSKGSESSHPRECSPKSDRSEDSEIWDEITRQRHQQQFLFRHMYLGKRSWPILDTTESSVSLDLSTKKTYDNIHGRRRHDRNVLHLDGGSSDKSEFVSCESPLVSPYSPHTPNREDALHGEYTGVFFKTVASFIFF